MPTIPISYPQILAINKGVNYYTNHTFPGIHASLFLNSSTPYMFTQPNEVNISNNLYNSQAVNYTLANTSETNNIGLTYNRGGNLVDVAIKYTNGKSIGNWYQIQRHASTPTGGSVSSENGVLRITCGDTSSLINRSLIHDTLFNRSGVPVLETSGTVTGYLQLSDTLNTTVYFNGYVEYFNFLAPTGFGTVTGKHTIFFVGYRYLHTQNVDESTSTPPIETYTGASNGFGFQAIRNGNNFTWHCVVIADDSVTNSGSSAICYLVNTNLSAFAKHKLKVNFNNGTITWYANGNQVATTTVASLVAAGNLFLNINNLYACAVSIKGGNPTAIPGRFTLCVNEASVIRDPPLTYNNWEDTDTEVTLTEIQYHNTGLQLLKKLK
jgi:hypothetical protein